jgi:hypothetical protein
VLNASKRKNDNQDSSDCAAPVQQADADFDPVPLDGAAAHGFGFVASTNSPILARSEVGSGLSSAAEALADMDERKLSGQ